MVEKKRRLIDDLLQDDFFGMKQEPSNEQQAPQEKTALFEDIEEVQAEEKSDETVSTSGTLFEEELIEDTDETETEQESLEESPETPQTKESEEKKKSGILIFILILLILAGGGGAAYFFILQENKPFIKKPLPSKTARVASTQKKKPTNMKTTSNKPNKQSTTVATVTGEVENKPAPTKSAAPTKKPEVRNSSQNPKTQGNVTKHITKEEKPKIENKPEKHPQPAQPKPVAAIPHYSLKAGPFLSKTLAIKWLKSLQSRGLETEILTATRSATLFYINAGTMDKSKAEALKLKIQIFMPDQAKKIVFQQQGNRVTFILGPYNDATVANGVIARLQTPKLNIKGKIFTRSTQVETYYLKIGKYVTRKEAIDAVSKLKKMGLNAEITGL